jgi:hypothetical protein
MIPPKYYLKDLAPPESIQELLLSKDIGQRNSFFRRILIVLILQNRNYK